jgi:DNA-binding response OmpR family regulator
MAKRILVVEDEARVAAVIQRRLEGAGYEVITAAEGREGLSKARTLRPDLIVLDLILPSMSGYQVCGMLKKDPSYRHIPILMLTARSQEKDVEEGMKVGADAYMTKPFHQGLFLDRVAELLEKAAKEADAEEQERSAQYLQRAETFETVLKGKKDEHSDKDPKSQ